ncbi:MAG: L,D-transpeptidase [Gaiellales bacterium]
MHDLQLPRVIVLILIASMLGIAALQFMDTQPAAIASAAMIHDQAPLVTPTAAPQAPAELVAARDVPEPAPVRRVVQKRGGVACASPHQLVTVPADTVVRSRPGARSRNLGKLPARSVYLGQPMTAWVQRTSTDGRWGLITLPWSKPVGQTGWVRLNGQRAATRLMIVSDLSTRRMTVYRGCTPVFSAPTAIGRAGSPSPQGRYWVSDRIAVPAAQQGSFGTYAFGLSTVQPNLPAGWSGGDQMAIHGTGAAGSIGQAASAGCLRVSEDTLARLKPLLRPGTPVIITA